MAILKKRWNNALLENPVHHLANPSVQDNYNIQTRAKIFYADWLSHHNNKENRDEVINGLDSRVDAVQVVTDVPECMSMQQIQQATKQDDHLQRFQHFIITGWPDAREQLHQNIKLYWSIKDEMSLTDGVVMRGRCIIIPKVLQQQVFDKLHVNQIDIEKNKITSLQISILSKY